MNIEGIELLREKGLPIFENFLSFRKISDIPLDFLDLYGEKKNWGICGSDDRIKLTSNPHIIRKFTKFHISREEIPPYFEKLSKEMLEYGVEEKNQIFVIWRCFDEENIEISGTAWEKEGEILIDFKKGMRVSGMEWTPSFHLVVLIVNGKIYFKNQIPEEYDLLARRICKDLLSFHREGAYLDFVMQKNGEVIYHDLGFY